MKQFFKFMFASMAGFFLSLVVLFFIMMGIVSGLMMTVKDEGVTVSDNSVLELKFENIIKERSGKGPFEDSEFGGLGNGSPGLDEILKSITKAKVDSRIKGIFINLTGIRAGIATVEEIRSAILDFKKSGKFIWAFSESYSQGAYYLASVADKVYLYPEGDVDLHGLSVNMMFFKGTIDKLELEPEIIRCGKFKSAVEPFMYDKMSDENRLQIRTFLNSVWGNILQDISTSRRMEVSSLQEIADDVKGRDANEALKLGLVDKLVYYDDVLKELKSKTGVDEEDNVKLVSLKKYSHAYVKTDEYSSKKIAVIFANGNIVSGEGDDDEVAAVTISNAIRKARTDSSIKAIVLRINSPGGSAIASDIIWRETVLAQKAKPLIVSMGDYAASGGYYIACAADTIVARPNTLTGSIGVFGLLFNAQNTFKNKLGITFDTVKTAKYADLGDATHPMSERERNIIQDQVNKIYETFKSHVAQGRGMSVDQVDSIGQGRIWSGTDALRLGLVDVLGGLDDAIKIAAKKANLSTYRTVELPEQKDFLQRIFEDINTEAKSYVEKQELGAAYTYYKQFNGMIKETGVLAKSPVIISFD